MIVYIIIAGLIGLLVGILICRDGIKERDKIIQELEYDIHVKQNVIGSNNETINRLRRELEKLKGGKNEND